MRQEEKILQLWSSSNFNRKWPTENYTLHLRCNGFKHGCRLGRTSVHFTSRNYQRVFSCGSPSTGKASPLTPFLTLAAEPPGGPWFIGRNQSGSFSNEDLLICTICKDKLYIFLRCAILFGDSELTLKTPVLRVEMHKVHPSHRSQTFSWHKITRPYRTTPGGQLHRAWGHARPRSQTGWSSSTRPMCRGP